MGDVILDKNQFKIMKDDGDELIIEAAIPAECPHLMAEGPHGMPACCEGGEDRPRVLGELAPLPLECLACQRGW